MNVSSQQFWRWSKYIFPLNRSAWNLSGAPAPQRLASLDDLHTLYPELVQMTDLGCDHNWGELSFPTLLDGRFEAVHASAEPLQRLRVFSLRDSSCVGRRCSVIGPGNTLVADLGYFVPNVQPHSLQWKDLLDIKTWRSRWLVDLRFRSQLPAIQRAPGTAVLLNNPWCHNYYHWLLEVAPRAMLIQQADLKADWYVVDCQAGFQKRALELMGIPPERCIQPHYGLHLQTDEILRPSYPGLQHLQMMADVIGRNAANWNNGQQSLARLKKSGRS